eukprot:s1108_g1.t1
MRSLMLGGLEKGKGAAGKSLEKGKGKGKGKGRGKGKALPLEDEDQEEEEELTLEKALKKVKKTRDLLSSTHDNFEEALKKVQKSLPQQAELQGQAGSAQWPRQDAWHLVTSTSLSCGRRGTYGLGRRWVRVTPRLFCVSSVALGGICLRFVWAWHLVASAFVLCGRRGAHGTGLALVTALAGAGASFCVASVALGDICLRFVWQALRLVTSTSLFAWQAWHLVTSAFVLCGRRCAW